jgi:putative ATP-dependent endonuclease of OLD family
MGIQLDPSFVPIVPLEGRYVRHFWKLLNELQIPHATLLDLDLGRIHGGANAIRTVVDSLGEIGNDLSRNSSVVLGEIDPDEINDLDDSSLLNGSEDNVWLKALKMESVYFSYPIDLDFSMLSAYPIAYQQPHLGGHGPKVDAESLQRNKVVTLKTGGNPELFDERFDDSFKWYPYLFLSRSKPETHLSALSRISKEDLVRNAPPELRALVEHVKNVLAIGHGGG